MFSHFLASALLAFSLLPPVVEPAGSNDTDYVTRAEASAAMLLARNPNVAVIKNTGAFPDIIKGSWYEPYMLSAERFGIITAHPSTHLLRPDGFVNRAEFLKMLSLTFNVPTGYPHGFQDVPKDAWYADYAGIVPKFHLPLATDPQHLAPTEPVTQEDALESIQIFLRLYNASQSSIFDEQQIAIDQSRNHLVLYNVISTRRTKVVFIDKKIVPEVNQAPINPPPSLPLLRTQILSLVNEVRLQANLKPLKYSAMLEESAQRYAEKMETDGFFGHVSPEGQTLKERVSATGYYDRTYSVDCNCIKGFVLGENLARGQKTAEEVMRDWMNSTDHRTAILSPDYTDIGVGVSSGLWVEHFGGVLLPGQKIAGTK